MSELKPTVAVARHGETTWNVAGRYQGRLESELSERGRAQAGLLAEAFASQDGVRPPFVPTRIVSSPLGRCRETARPLAERLGLELEIDERLVEIGHGSWEGLLRDEIAERDPERYRLWREHPGKVAFDGGETLAEVAERWNAFARDLAARSEPTVVLTHDAVVRIALLSMTNAPFDAFWKVRVENAAFALAARREGALELIRDCEAAHLHALRTSTSGQAL